jgi:hypothetical protein
MGSRDASGILPPISLIAFTVVEPSTPPLQSAQGWR